MAARRREAPSSAENETPEEAPPTPDNTGTKSKPKPAPGWYVVVQDEMLPEAHPFEMAAVRASQAYMGKLGVEPSEVKIVEVT
jgi:hypothetical protein